MDASGKAQQFSVNFPSNYSQRLHYMDQLRAFAMLAGIFFHACLPYAKATQDLWILSDASSSYLLYFIASFFHLFRMPLFFLVAGFFAHLIIVRKGTGTFLKNRLIRIGAPFILLLPLIWVFLGGFFFALFNYLQPEEMSLMMRYVQSLPQTGESNWKLLTTGHLWFLYNLLYFCAIAAVIGRLNWQPLANLFDRLFCSAKHLLYLPLLLVPALYTVVAPVPAADRLIPQLWSYGYYGLFFIFGWQFFRRQYYLDTLEPHINKLIAFCVIATPIFLALIFAAKPDLSNGISEELLVNANLPPSYDPQGLLTVLLEAYLSTYLTIISLSLGKKLLNRENAYMRYLSDASYWLYLIHPFLMLPLQLVMVRLEISVFSKVTITLAVVCGIALLIYDTLIRYSFVGEVLNGRKVRTETGITALITSQKAG